jgi:hypothetical protein
MDKGTIKKILREFVESKILTEKRDYYSIKKTKKKKRDKIDKDYASIQNKLIDSDILTQAGVMQAAGLGDAGNATDRSLFSKKLRKVKNDEGGMYKFNDDELSRISKVVNNPLAFTARTGKKTKTSKKKKS